MPNHATVPALEGVKPASIAGVDCEQLKADFGIETGTHKENRSGTTKKNSRSYQSHHIVQDAQTNSIIDRDLARAVMLNNSHGGTEHGTITGRQNERMRNKSAGVSPGPASTFGELREQAKGDLMAGLEERRKEKNRSKEELEKLADCLVAEAEKEVKKEYNRKHRRKKMTDSTPVAPPGECLSADTFVWLANRRAMRADKLKSNLVIETLGGPMRIVRTDRCRSSLIEIVVLGTSVSLAPFHRVLTAYGYFLRADRLRPGHEVMTKNGKAAIAEIKSHTNIETVYNFGVGKKTTCRVGPAGIWIEVVDTGPPVIRTEAIIPISNKEIRGHAKS